MPVPAKRGQETVDRLLDAALDVYSQRGRDGFSLTAVLELSGVSVGSLYHHFSNFDGLSATLYNRCTADLLTELLACLDPHDNAADGVRAMAAGYLEWSAKNPAKARIVHFLPYAGYLPDNAKPVDPEPADLYREIVMWFNPYLVSGHIQPLAPVMIELLVCGPVAATTKRWLAGDPGIDMNDAARLIPERVWQSVRGPRG
ncbi:TetR/AcrR family transcriptional regulator [Phytomonospora sp. NPDC050363]|uniref:TetR/AcrR family transcriptional regulator n=1 Tax=Phytomonospora sp. NPDC050363 TaxID=3155642 RepID=UPI0033DB1BE3